MRFQKRILSFYTIFAAAITLSVTLIYLLVTVNNFSVKLENEISTVSGAKTQQLENLFENMEAVTTYLLSDPEVLEAVTVLSESQHTAGNFRERMTQYYFNREVTKIRSRLKTYYMLKSFYKIVLFDVKNNVVSNSARQNIASGFSFSEYPWAGRITGTKGKGVILGRHADDWDPDKADVISVVREILLVNKSYIEVQMRPETLAEQLRTDKPEYDFILLTKTGELIYSTDDSLDIDSYRAQVGDDGAVRTVRTDENERVLMMEQASKSQDLMLLTVNHTNLALMAVTQVLPIALALFIILFGASFLYSYFAARHLTKPIRMLQQVMERTELGNITQEMERAEFGNITQETERAQPGNITQEMPEKLANDEISALYLAYKEVLVRLHESIVKEKRLSVLQLQAQFDLLQAQVNPHFLYNVLNVISERALMLDDEEICDICSDLSAMLRYATNTETKYATVADEITYLKLYLSLLKYRYRDKLEYHIDIEGDIHEERLPKIVLQQLVENSIRHGYRDQASPIRIDITGGRTKAGWYVCVADEGCGITSGTKEELLRQIEALKRKLSDDRSNVEMSLGGMGIVNTFARLYLIYADRVELRLENGADGGAEVTIAVEKQENSS